MSRKYLVPLFILVLAGCETSSSNENLPEQGTVNDSKIKLLSAENIALKSSLQMEKGKNQKLNSELESCRAVERRASSKAEILAENFELSQKMAVGLYEDRRERNAFYFGVGSLEGATREQLIDRLHRAEDGDLLSWEEYIGINRIIHNGLPYKYKALVDPISVDGTSPNIRLAIGLDSQKIEIAKKLADSTSPEEVALIQYNLLPDDVKEDLIWPVSIFTARE